MSKRGRLIVISAPSGGGKSAILNEVLRRRPEYAYSLSTTTRPRRHYEVEGEHYHFVSQDEFRRKIKAGDFAEWAEVHGNLYGTQRKTLERELEQGRYVLLDIDVYGGEAIRNLYPDETIAIFLFPPSITELRRRLANRGSEDSEAIEQRLSRYSMEKKKGEAYPIHIVNDDLEKAVQEVLEVIDSAG